MDYKEALVFARNAIRDAYMKGQKGNVTLGPEITEFVLEVLNSNIEDEYPEIAKKTKEESNVIEVSVETFINGL